MMEFIAAAIIAVASLVAIIITLAALPGTWLLIAIALMCQLWQRSLFSWWTIGAVFVLALLAEVIEFFASAAGSAKAGGTRRGAIGSIVGAILGAILGTPVFPILGTIVGGILGAGLGAVIGERYRGEMQWNDAFRVGRGAATGRMLSILIKATICTIIAIVLLVGAVVR